MNRICSFALCLASVLTPVVSTHAQVTSFAMFPQGRLTLQSGSAVMTSDVTNATTVYYVPYSGNVVACYSTSSHTWGNCNFGPLTLALPSNLTAGDIYDIYSFLTSGGVTLGVNVTPWNSTSGRGSGGAAIQQATSGFISGLWVNTYGNPTTTMENGTTSYNVQAQTGVYLGSVYITSSGETSMQFKPTPATGGTGNILGLYNAYNRVRTISRNIDSANPPWTDSTASWQLLDVGNSTSTNTNTISFLDGLQESSVDSQASVNIIASSSSVVGYIALSLDNTTPPSTGPGGFIGLTSQSISPYGVGVHTFDHFEPQYGFHYVAAVQYATGATITYNPSSGGTEELKLELEM